MAASYDSARVSRRRSSTMEHKALPLDIVEDILLRLPVKMLHRLRCVSKPWYALISSFSFQKEHYRRYSQQNPLLLIIQIVNNDSGGVPYLQFSIYSDEGALLSHFSKPFTMSYLFHEIKSCFGLVCLGSMFPKNPIVLCNPSTEQLITLPPPSTKGFNQYIGLGFTLSTVKFKVVRFFSRNYNAKDTCCEIFTLGTTDGWREARNSPPFRPLGGFPFLHGALHLMPNDCKPRDNHYIAVFDMDTEEYRTILFPEIYFSEESSLFPNMVNLNELRGSLCLAFNFAPTGREVLGLWFLKDYYGGKWVKEYNVDMSVVPLRCPLAIMDDGSILPKAFDEQGLSYELGSYTTQEMGFRRKYCMQKIHYFSPTTLYVESFLQLESLHPNVAFPDQQLNPPKETDDLDDRRIYITRCRRIVGSGYN